MVDHLSAKFGVVMQPESSSTLLEKQVILMPFYLFQSWFSPFHMLAIYFCNNNSNLILLTKLCHGSGDYWPLTVEVWVQPQVAHVGFVVDKVALQQVFL